MAGNIKTLEEVVIQMRCGEIPSLDDTADLIEDAIGEIERLRERLHAAEKKIQQS